jgi:hypothetical protein
MKRTGQAAPRIPLIRNSQIAVPIDGGATAAHRPSPAHYEISADPLATPKRTGPILSDISQPNDPLSYGQMTPLPI